MKLLVMPRLDFQDKGVFAQVGKLMLPAIIGSSAAQISLLVNTILASFLVTGSVSWLYYSDRLMEFPLGIFGIALATVILPALADTHHSRTRQEFSALLDWAMRWVALIGLPASVALIFLSDALVATLFQYGEFTAWDVEMASKSLVAFSIGLPGFILIKVLAPGFFARQDTTTPARIAVIAVVVNILVSLIFIKPLAHVGLALAVTVSAYVNSGLLYYILRKQGDLSACSRAGLVTWLKWCWQVPVWVPCSILVRVTCSCGPMQICLNVSDDYLFLFYRSSGLFCTGLRLQDTGETDVKKQQLDSCTK